MTDDLSQKVREWIERSGYSLEMEVAKICHRVGFSPLQSEFYEDAESGKTRETDIVAHLVRKAGKKQATLTVVLECKVSPEKPWVLFSAPNKLPGEFSVRQRAASRVGEQVLNKLAGDESIQNLELFRLPDVLGYSLVAASLDSKDKNGQKDRAYEAVWSVTKATTGMVTKVQKFVPSIALVALPMIVLRGRLFEARLDSDGAIALEEISKGVLGWRNPVLAEFASFIMVATEKGAEESLAKLHEDGQEFLARAIQLFKD